MMSNPATMKELIAAVGAFLVDARSFGTIMDVKKAGASRVWYGYQSKAGQGIPLTAYPYILLDDGGERTEVINGTTQTRTYRIEVELMGHYDLVEDSLNAILNFSNQVKAAFELRENRLMEGMIFGVQITPILTEAEQGRVYRGRRIVVEYKDMEDIFEQF